MKTQTKAAHCSLALHAVLVLCAFAFNQYAAHIQPPTVMDMSIIMSGAAPGESEGPAAQAPPAPPVKEKTVTPAAKKQVVKTTPAPKPRPVAPKKIEPAPAVNPAQPTFAAPAEEEAKPDAAVADSEQPKQSGEASASAATAAGKPGATPKGGGAGGGGLFTASQLDSPLTMLAKSPPVYPHSAKRRNIEGWIKVKFVVDEHGQVDQVTVLDAEPEGVFEQSVLRCIASWRFKPGTIGGMAVKALVEQTITFKLEG